MEEVGTRVGLDNPTLRVNVYSGPTPLVFAVKPTMQGTGHEGFFYKKCLYIVFQVIEVIEVIGVQNTKNTSILKPKMAVFLIFFLYFCVLF